MALAQSGSSDHFTFELGAVAHEIQGAPGGTLRARVIARVAGSVFADFHIDLSSGDALVGEPEVIEGSNLLQFAGIEPVRFPVYPIPQHLAEKLHAYTLPRSQENTRVKDLLDLAALATMETVHADRLVASLQATFAIRRTHLLPDRLPQPPDSWAGPFAKLASLTPTIPTTRLEEAYQIVAGFWDALLAGHVFGTVWHPTEQNWKALDGNH